MKEINTAEIAEKVVGRAMPIIESAAVAALVGKVTEAVVKSIATNVNESDVSGDKQMHPTKEDSSLEKGEANASRNNAALAQDDVSGQKGEVDATETEAKAATGEATASESGASAVRTKAGASDIETKALKMM